MRFYISADIEGMPGVVSRDDLLPGRFGYESACETMTDTVVIACEALRELGAETVVISDSHGNGQNIRFARMPPYVQLVRSWPRPLGMMQGIETGHYDGALLIGYHAGASNIAGTLAHTIHGGFFQEVRLNGKPVSEAMISAAIAGHFGVPILMIAGDDVVVAETREALGDIAVACVKTSLGWQSVLSLAPAAAAQQLQTAIRDAVSRIGHAKPHLISAPISLEIRLRSRFMAEWLDYLDAIERPDAYTIRYRAADIVSVSRFLSFLSSARSAIE